MLWSRSGTRSWLRSPNEGRRSRPCERLLEEQVQLTSQNKMKSWTRSQMKSRVLFLSSRRFVPATGIRAGALVGGGMGSFKCIAQCWRDALIVELGCDGRQPESSPAQSSLIRPPNMPGEKAWSAHKWRRPKKLKLQSSVVYILELNPARTVVLVLTHHRLSWQTYGRASITFKHPTILKGAPVTAFTQNI